MKRKIKNVKNTSFSFGPFNVKDTGLCFASAFLLTLAFPKNDWWLLAWVGLIPLLFALDGKSRRDAFNTAYLCGFFFFAGTLYWVGHVTVVGAAALVAYLALYFGAWGIVYQWLSARSLLVRMIMLPSGWALLEWIRANFLSGFDWAGLGYSQYKNIAFIQIADVTGVIGVSFTLVLINVALKELMLVVKGQVKLNRDIVFALIIIVAVIIGQYAYGIKRLTEKVSSPSMSVAVIQGNTPHELKWTESVWPDIVEAHLTLTTSVAEQRPDLIIWPETSYPGIVSLEDGLLDPLKSYVEVIGVPLLFGTVLYEPDQYFNAAVLLYEDGQTVEEYHKMHLVPFGEYIPMRWIFPFLSSIVPIEDFTAGREHKLFPLLLQKNGQWQSVKFSTLICFEDAVASLVRAFVRQGAQVLVNITNDSWFKDTKEPYMHLQSSVFRAVENRRAVVRAANTGVSCFIDPFGRVIQVLKDNAGRETYVSTTAVGSTALRKNMSFYTLYGDLFVSGCFVVFILGLLFSREGLESFWKR